MDSADRISDLRYAIENYGLDGVPGPRTTELMAWARDEILHLRRRLKENEAPVAAAIRKIIEAEAGRDSKLVERAADAPRSYPAGATSTSHPSLPSRFRSRFYYERDGWDAHVKVDYDAKNPFVLARVKEITKIFPAWFGPGGRVARAEVYRSSRKEHHHHLRIWFDPAMSRLPAGAILGIQEMLGDDPTRMKLNAGRVDRDEPGWNVLWCEKYVNGVSISCEVLDETLTSDVALILKGKRP